jgi:hypothetical protein
MLPKDKAFAARLRPALWRRGWAVTAFAIFFLLGCIQPRGSERTTTKRDAVGREAAAQTFHQVGRLLAPKLS